MAEFGAGRRRRTAAKLGMKFGSDLHDGGGGVVDGLLRSSGKAL